MKRLGTVWLWLACLHRNRKETVVAVLTGNGHFRELSHRTLLRRGPITSFFEREFIACVAGGISVSVLY